MLVLSESLNCNLIAVWVYDAGSEICPAIIPDKKQEFPFEFFIRPTHIFILNSDYASVSASGQLNFRGNAKGAKLQGTLNVDRAVVHLEEALPFKLKTVDIRYINMCEGDSHAHYSENAEETEDVSACVTR